MKRHTYRDMAADVAHFIDEHSLGPVTLLGHSMFVMPLHSCWSLPD